MAQTESRVQPPAPVDRWSNRRIIFLAFVSAIIFYAIFNLPSTINYVLTRARQTLILIILAIGLTYLLLPLVDLLTRIPVPIAGRSRRTIAAVVALLVFVVLLVALIAVVITPITNELGKTLTTVTQWVQTDLATTIDNFLDRTVNGLPEPYRSQAREQILVVEQQLSGANLAETVRQRINQWGGAILQWQINFIGSVLSSGAYLIALLIVPVFAYYFLTDASSIRHGTAAHVPPEARQRYHQMLGDMHVVIRGYVHTIMIVSLISGIAMALTLYFAGVRAYLTFGILAGVANMVPVVGGIVAVVMIAAISLMTVGFKVTLVIMAVYASIQLVTDRVIAPKLMSKGANLHPVAVIVALLAGAEFFGIIGVFVAVPVVAAARVAWIHYRAYISNDYHSHELDDLLGRARGASEVTTGQEALALDEGGNTTKKTDSALSAAPTDEDEAADGDA